MNKYSCTTSTVGSIHFVTLIAENEQQAKEMAAAEAKVGPAARLERQGSGVRPRGAGADHCERQPGSLKSQAIRCRTGPGAPAFSRLPAVATMTGGPGNANSARLAAPAQVPSRPGVALNLKATVTRIPGDLAFRYVIT